MRDNKKRFPVKKEEFETLKEIGFPVHKFTPYHYRIKKFEDQSREDMYIDIFPTTKKYCVYRNTDFTGTGSYETYKNVIDFIEFKFNEKR